MTLRSASFLCGVVALVTLGSGCDRVYLADDIDLEFNFSLLTGPQDAMHLPYVKGTEVTIGAYNGDEDSRRGWYLEVADPRVLSIVEQADGTARCRALAAGETEIYVYDRQGGDLLASTPVSVAEPDRLELHANGPLVVGLGREDSLTPEPRVLENRTSTFLVRYFRGNTRLYGNGVLGISASAGLDAASERTYLFENREWLRLSPRAAGDYTLDLSAAGVPLGTVKVHGLAPAGVGQLVLVGQSEAGAEDGDWLTVLGMAYDKENRPIYGAEFSWTLENETQPGGLGDLYRYRFLDGRTRMLSAAFGELSADLPINVDHGYVDSSNELGCTMTPVGAPGRAGLGALAALALALALVRRRRR